MQNVQIEPKHGKTVIGGDLNKNYIATTALDGYLHVIKSAEKEQDMELKKRVQIISEVGDKMKLGVAFHPSKDLLAVSGSAKLRVCSADSDWELSEVEEISHEQSITLVCWINETTIATVGLEGKIRVWDFTLKKMLHEADSKNTVKSIKYDHVTKYLACFDVENNLIYNQFTFTKEPQIYPGGPQEIPVSSQTKEPETYSSAEKKIENLNLNHEPTMNENRPQV